MNKGCAFIIRNKKIIKIKIIIKWLSHQYDYFIDINN